MLKTPFTFLLLLAAVHSQSPKPNGVLNFIFDLTTSTTVSPARQTTEKDLSCTLPDGRKGGCVPYYRCNVNNSASTVSTGTVDIRVPCASYIDTCCPLPEKSPLNQPQKPDEPQPEGCGWANSGGIGSGINFGQPNGETNFGEFPWMVGILQVEPINDTDPNGHKLNIYIGGGSLIHPRVVLTAAHVVATAKSLRARAGEWDTQTTKELYPYQDRVVSSVEIHKKFHKGNLFYDIAILFLARPMVLAPNVRVACLPPPRVRQEDGTRCVATGWGKHNIDKKERFAVILKKVELSVVKKDKCQAALRKTPLGMSFQLHPSFMCAGAEPGKDTCKGDGGSPLSCPINNDKSRYVQSGIVSWGIGCGEDGSPGVYTDVSVFRKWIDEKVSGKGYLPETYTY